MPINQSYRDVHVDTLLSNFSVALWQDTSVFVGTRFFGVQNVSKASDKFKVFEQGFFNRSVKSRRAEEGVANSIGYKSGEDSYSCDDDALRIFVSDRKRANTDSQEMLDQASTRVVVDSLLLAKEEEFVEKFLTAGKWAKDYQVGTDALPGSGTKNWSDTTAEIESNVVLLAEDFVKQSGGRKPNKILMTLDVYNIVRLHPSIKELVSGGATTAMPAKVMKQKLAELFEVDEVVVMQSIVNLANDEVLDGNDKPVANNQFVAEGVFLMVYVDQAGGLMAPTAAATFVHSQYVSMGVDNGPSVRRYAGSPGQKGEYIESELSIDQKLVAPDLGLFLYDIA
ncbi:hypothetical protein SIPHO063v1_p0070 [Vibrio phage PS10B.1]|nr:hypothetical protein SIPHO063v1_p0070 [Vibrio phage PS10B.1]